MATLDLAEYVVGSAVSYPPEVDEFEILKIQTAPSRCVSALRVNASPIQFECRLKTSIFFKGNTSEANTNVIFGDVVGIHIADSCIKDDMIDLIGLKPLARIGYLDYICIDRSFTVRSPHEKPLGTVPFLNEAGGSILK
jgi:flavin reductase (DIM6/NTAB) family NADH-FMN oxidoreductase RutF